MQQRVTDIEVRLTELPQQTLLHRFQPTSLTITTLNPTAT